MRILALVLVVAVQLARADEQIIAPGTAEQDAVVVNTGPDGICQTTAATGDIQAAPVGSGTPFRTEIRCGGNKLVETTAAGDDTQLIAVGAACKGANNPIIDTGPNGVADTTAAGDDTQVIAVGTTPANTPCVITGGNGVADTGTTAGDDVLVLTPVGSAAPNSAVIQCGPNLVADTAANNVTGGDDVQVIPVGNACSSATDVVVDSGADGIATTRAEGPDLVLKVPRPLHLTIPRGRQTASRTVKLIVSNVEFGATAPAGRTYRLNVTKGSCPSTTVNQIDADASTTTLDATAVVPKGSHVKASFVVTAHLEDVTTVASNVPFRCAVGVDAIAVDTDPDVDDAANAENNSATVEVDISDSND
ncbi:MAG TPA: hypothetical protein VKU61_05455 [Candidatus Binatia bacterium]|nr:hypothetical protein [Candidatus Binatia bacterium]